MFFGKSPLHLLVLCLQQLLANRSALHLALVVALSVVVILYLSRLESINQKASRRLYCCFVCYQETKYALPLASAVHVCM